RLVGTPVQADRPEACRRFVEETIVSASHSERPKRERLDVRPRVHPLLSLRLDPVTCGEGYERVQERCSTVVQTDTVYSGGHAGAGARPEIDGVDEPLDRR